MLAMGPVRSGQRAAAADGLAWIELQAARGGIKMKRRVIPLLVVAGLLGFASPAWANAGTPLMWAGMLHLVAGNALIGLLEGALLGWLFGAPRGRAMSVMILANYISAWLGGLLIRGAIVDSLPMDLDNGWMWFWVMVAVTYGITLALEWPFVAWCFRETGDWLRRSLQSSLVVQSVSYVLLFGWYWAASGTSLYTRMDIVPVSELDLPEFVRVYYIRLADGSVCQRELAGSIEQKVFDLQSANKNDRLFARRNAADTNRWDLMARRETDDRRPPELVEVRTNLVGETAADLRMMEDGPRGTWFSIGEAPRIGSATRSPWAFRAGFWPVEGLRGHQKATGERVHFSYETPFGAWTVRNAVHLPSDIVLFQLGDNQICSFDPATRRVALLWHGRGPVAVIEEGQDGRQVER